MSTRRRIALTASLGLAMVMVAAVATAQTPGRGGQGGLSRLDANGDGILQPNEIPARAKPFIGRIAQRAGLDPNGPIPLDRLPWQAGQGGRGESRDEGQGGNERYGNGSGEDGDQQRGDQRRGDERGRGDDNDRRRDRDDDRPERRPDAIPIPVSGFGLGMPFPKVPGFDVPLSATSQGGPTVAELAEQLDGRVISFARRLLERADENANQIVDPAEWGRLRWRGDPNELDLNRDARLTLAELIQGVAREQEERRRRDGDNGQQQEGDRGPDGERGDDDDKVAEYARNLIREHDRNNNGVIDRDERGGLRGDPARADADRNGVITEAELVARMRGSSDAANKATEARQRATEARQSADRSGNGRNRSAERAPAWFRSRDQDGDGQVAMSEYTTSWDDAKVAEFAARDTNGDGVIALSEASP